MFQNSVSCATKSICKRGVENQRKQQVSHKKTVPIDRKLSNTIELEERDRERGERERESELEIL